MFSLMKGRLDNISRLVASWGALAFFSATGTAAPSITRPPADAVVANGQNATFTVIATGTGNLSYQWERNGFPIVGATSDTYIVSRATRAAMDSYHVVVTDRTGSTRSPSARLWVSPTNYPGDITPDPAVDLQLETDEETAVNVVLPTSDGGYFVGGSFTTINGLPRSGIAHITAAGQVDTAFRTAPIRLMGTGVQALARQNGKLIIAGQFTTVGGLRRNAVARLNPDGSVDPSFDATTVFDAAKTIGAVAVFPDARIAIAPMEGQSGIVVLKPDGAYDQTLMNSAQLVDAVASQADGKLIVVGEFTVWDQGTFWQNVVRFNPDGSVDHTFASKTVGHTPIGVAVAGDGSILIGGSMTSFDGVPVGGLVRLKPDGTLDRTFAPIVSGPPGNATWQVHTVAVQQNGNVVFGGVFNAVNGTARNYVAGVTSAGVLTDFASTSRPAFVHSLAVLNDDTVVLGTEGPGVPSPALQHFSRAGVALATNFALRSRGGPSAIAPLPSGQYLLCGAFEYAAGMLVPGVVRLNRDGTLDPSFHAPPIPDIAVGTVRTAAALADGRVAIGGFGYSYNNAQRLGLVLLRPDGTEDPSFDPPANVISQVNCVAVLPDSRLLVTGSNQAAGQQAVPAIAMFKLDGSLDRSFSSGSGFNGEVSSMVVQPDGRVVAAGDFTAYDGTPCMHVARLNLDGSLDSSFSANAHFTGNVTALALAPEGKIYANGGWQTPEGKFYELVRLNADGTFDPTFTDQDSSIPVGMLAQEDGKVIYRNNASSLVRLDADGRVDSSFASRGFDPLTAYAPTTILMRDDGQLLVLDAGGLFGTYSLTADSGPPAVTAPPSQVVSPGATPTLTAVASSLRPTMYQWYLDGTAIAGATAASYTLPPFTPGSEGAYTVTATNDFGSTTSPATLLTAPATTLGRLANLSVRTTAGTGNASLIVGYVLGGNGTGGTKALLVRGVGPTLANFGVHGALADPVLQLYDGASNLIDQNDDWAGVFDFTTLGAFPFAGEPPKDAAIYNPYAAAGGGSIIVSGKNGAIGLALGEVYDATPASDFTVFTPRLINGSARSTVGAADEALILGFVIGGNSTERLLVRAVGPTLAQAPFNVTGTLADPVLDVYDSSGSKLASNDNWGDNAEAGDLTAVFSHVGAFSLASTTSKDAALVLVLAPGSYSAVVRGSGNTTGVALVELYEVP